MALLALGACAGGEGAADGGAPDGGAFDAGQAVDGGGHPDAGPAGFALSSSAFVDGGTLPAEFTCDGAGHSPPLSWTAGPAGTVGYALLMHTDARDGRKWNWVLYDLPAGTTSLSAGQVGVGTAGKTSDGPQLAYAPPCSQGPGEKRYTFTVDTLTQSTFTAKATVIGVQATNDTKCGSLSINQLDVRTASSASCW